MATPSAFSRGWRGRLGPLLVAAVLVFFSDPLAVYGTVLDWPSSGWTAGAPAPGQTATQSFTAVTPNDVTVSINNNGSSSQGGTWQSGYPAINSTNTTGGFSGVNGIQLFVTHENATSSIIKTTVTFAAPIINLSFQIWDVDASSGQFADKISSIQGLAVGGGTVGADSVTSAVSGYNTITGSGLSTVVLGTAAASNTTNQGSINIAFNGPITEFSFNWSNNDSGLGQQAIALGPLTYNVVPESSLGWGASLFCVVAIGAWEISRRRRILR